MDTESLRQLFDLAIAMGLFYGVCRLILVIVEAFDDLF